MMKFQNFMEHINKYKYNGGNRKFKNNAKAVWNEEVGGSLYLLGWKTVFGLMLYFSKKCVRVRSQVFWTANHMVPLHADTR